MIVVSDTSPLHYLILIGDIEVVPRIVNEVIIPAVVFRELNAEKTPQQIKTYLETLPAWLTIADDTGIIDDELAEIDPGEREAILLTEQLSADALLIDDKAGREIAESRGIKILGTLGLLEIAADRGLLNFAQSLTKMKHAGFFISRSLEKDFLSRRGVQ